MFSVQQRLSELDLKPYEFLDADGVKRTLPNIGLYTAQEVEALTAEFDSDPMEALKKIADGDNYTALLSIPAALLMELAKDWMEHCGLGESSASSRTTANTARPSTPTLPATSGRRARRRR